MWSLAPPNTKQKKKPEHDLYVVVDPEGELTEISETNNIAHVRMTFDLQSPGAAEKKPAQTGGGRRR